MNILILLTALIPSLLVISKIFKKLDISSFDIFISFCTVFYILIPFKGYYIDEVVGFNLNQKREALIVATIFLYVLLFLNHKLSTIKIFNLSYLIREVNKKIYVNHKIFYLSIVMGSMMLYKVANYSGLDSDNPEANNQLYFGSELPFYLRMFWLLAYHSVAILFILCFQLVLKLRNNVHLSKVRTVGYISLIIIFLYFLLGPKTKLISFLIFVLLYFYSIYKNYIHKKQMLIIGGIGIAFLLIFFPISQGLRLTKQAATSTGRKLSFINVVDAYINMKSVDRENLEQKVSNYVAGRSLNVFNTLDWTCTKSFQGEGKLSYGIIKSLLPLKIADLGVNGNILGDVYMFKGADIGESVLAWFNADVRYWGILLATLFMIIAYSCFYWYYYFFSKLLKNKLILLLGIFMLYKYSIEIECAPALFFRQFYVEQLLTIISAKILFGFILKKNHHDKNIIENRLVG